MFDYLIQQASPELNYMPFASDRCGPRLKRKEFRNLFWYHASVQSINGFNLDSDFVQKFLKYYTILAKMAKHCLLSVGSQVMWESLVMKKQMQLQTQHSLYLSLRWSFLPQTRILVQQIWYLMSGRKYGIASLEINYMLLDLLKVATNRKHVYRA